jgi:hypothetical protein
MAQWMAMTAKRCGVCQVTLGGSFVREWNQRGELIVAKGLSLNNRIGWWRGDPFTPSCRRRSASTSVLAAISKTWMVRLRAP